MSHQASYWAKKVRGLRWAERMVLGNLADHANGEGRAWPSVATIAGEEGIGQSTVKRALRGLEARGLIRPERPGGGRKATTVYVVANTGNPVRETGFSGTETRSERPKTRSDRPKNPVRETPESVIEPVKNRAHRPTAAARGGRAGAPESPADAAGGEVVGAADNEPQRMTFTPPWDQIKSQIPARPPRRTDADPPRRWRVDEEAMPSPDAAPGPAARPKRRFGNVRRLRSGRFQARWEGPDGYSHKAPATFAGRAEAEAWLTQQRALRPGGEEEKSP